jgi:hypothetical protein
MDYQVRIQQMTVAQPLAVVRRRASRGELSKVVPEACGLVWNVLKSQKVKGAGRHVAIYLDCEINLEVGVEMNAPFAGCGEVVSSTLPTDTIATTTHFGPYNQLSRAHDAIQQWCATNGHTLSGPNWEIYGHWQDAWNRDPSQSQTDVFYLLVK